MKFSVKSLVMLAMLAALSVVLMYLVRFPIFPAMPFLEYDMADVPILIGTFLLGPLAGLILTVVVSVLQGVSVSAGSGVIGILMHILATGTFVLVAGFTYKRFHSLKGAVLSLVLGGLAMTAVMIPLNLVFTGLFSGRPVSEIAALLGPVIIPFNLIKAGINGAVTFTTYKLIGRAARRLLPAERESGKKISENR